MNQYTRPPDPLPNTGDMVQNWRKWKDDFMNFMKANNHINKPMNIKVYLLVNYIGKFGQDILEKIVSNNLNDVDNINVLLLKLDMYFDPPKNEVAERYNFFSSLKKPKETIESYINDLQMKAERCNFGESRDSLIRDKIIAELKDMQLIKKLISVENLDLSMLISIYKSNLFESQVKKQIASGSNTTSHQAGIKGDINYNQNTNSSNNNAQTRNTSRRNCRKCEQRHPIRCCPAWGFKCENCGERNHFTHCCPHNFTNSEGKEENINLNLQEENQENPSAPPLYAVDNNTLYPSLNHMVLERKMDANTWTWMGQQNTNANDKLQKSAASVSPKEGRKSSANVPRAHHHKVPEDKCCVS